MNKLQEVLKKAGFQNIEVPEFTGKPIQTDIEARIADVEMELNIDGGIATAAVIDEEEDLSADLATEDQEATDV